MNAFAKLTDAPSALYLMKCADDLRAALATYLDKNVIGKSVAKP